MAALAELESGERPPDQAPPADVDASPAVLTLRIRRSHVVGLLLITLGAGLGFGAARFTQPEPEVVFVSAPPAAAQAVPSTPAQGVDEPVELRLEGRPSEGPADAKVTLVEFTDYECPYCGRHFREVLPQLRQRYGERVRLVYMNFPLASHANATKAAEAAECAHRQNRFVAMHDALFENQRALDVASLKALARQVGLDGASFDTCLDSGAASQQVASDVEQARRVGVRGTPTFFVNGVRTSGAQAVDTWFQRLDAALSEPDS